MNRRQWMQSSLAATRALATWRSVRGDEPQDDSDPAPLIAKLGARLANIPIEHTEKRCS